MCLLLLLQTLCVGLSLATLTVLSYGAREYFRAKHLITQCGVKMDGLLEELLDDVTTRAPESWVRKDSAPAAQSAAGDESTAKRERLITIAAGGQAVRYFGKAYKVGEIDRLDEEGISKLYARYEARLGAAMTKTLERAALQLYTSAVGMFLPIPFENCQPLMADLESDPFVSHALNSGACELYHRYGQLLAPITAALTTARYCQFGQHPVAIENGGPGQQSDTSGFNVGDGGTSVEGDRSQDHRDNQTVA